MTRLNRVAIFNTVHMQYFRNLDGYKLRDRGTISLVSDDAPARWLVVVSVLLCSCLAPSFWQMDVTGFLLAASPDSVMVFNLLWKITPEADGMT